MLALFWSCMRHLFDAVSKQTLVNKVMVGEAHSSEQYKDWSSKGTNCFSQIMLSKQKPVSLGFSKVKQKRGICRNRLVWYFFLPLPLVPTPPTISSHLVQFGVTPIACMSGD